MKFIDEVTIFAGSGHGGPGAVTFLREKGKPRGGPDGGDGGRGGDLIFKVNPQMSSLLELKFKKKYMAQDGAPGTSSNKQGKDGLNLVIDVPPGTRVINDQGEVLGELNTESEEFLLFKGGRGGKGNAFFKTSVNQAPQYAQPGEPGESGELKLELKLLADVGIIGYPNVGKSTLISRISAARPKAADYEFTTLVPNLGVVAVGEGQNVVVADIPGLIPGAHQGAGLGIRFLKHIEKTRGFVHLIDVSDLSERDPLKDYEDINYELEMYDEQHKETPRYTPLMNKQQVIVFNKIDAADSIRVENLRRKFLKKEGVREVLTVSAYCGHGMKELIHQIGRLALESKENKNH
ncbi:MAG: GTPase ObgE [Bdellovibrionales bacterium]